MLVPDQNKYVLKVLGKNAEPIAAAKLLCKLKHRYFAKPLEYKLQTDKDGNIKLGELPDIDSLEVLPLNAQNDVLLFKLFNSSRATASRCRATRSTSWRWST